jgi:hypothetical protein
MRKERHDRKSRHRVAELSRALHLEKQISLELSRALTVQIMINNTLRERINERGGGHETFTESI